MATLAINLWKLSKKNKTADFANEVNQNCACFNQFFSLQLVFFWQEKIMAYIKDFCENEDDEIYHKFIQKITGRPLGSAQKQ